MCHFLFPLGSSKAISPSGLPWARITKGSLDKFDDPIPSLPLVTERLPAIAVFPSTFKPSTLDGGFI